MNEKTSGYRITDLAVSERPRERLAEVGVEALTNAELLAILLRVGVEGENAVQMGQRLLIEFGGLPGLHRASLVEMCRHRGVGVAKAAQIKAAIELGRRVRTESSDSRYTISKPEDAADLVRYEMSALPQENLWVINLDTRNRVINIEKLYKGSLNASTVRVGELFKPAIQRMAASIILTHNHPSGDPTPSREDRDVTVRLMRAGEILGVPVIDHVVVAERGFCSLREEGALGPAPEDSANGSCT